MAAEAMAGAGATAAAKVASEEAIKIRRSRSARNWAGLDSNQRRRKASRFTVCPVWPLRNLPFAGKRSLAKAFRVHIGWRAARRNCFGRKAPGYCRLFPILLFEKLGHRFHHISLSFPRNLRINRQRQNLAGRLFGLGQISVLIGEVGKTFLLVQT